MPQSQQGASEDKTRHDFRKSTEINPVTDHKRNVCTPRGLHVPKGTARSSDHGGMKSEIQPRDSHLYLQHFDVRQEDGNLKASLGYTVCPYLKTKQ